jgi:prolyl 4-hydroxylase
MRFLKQSALISIVSSSFSTTQALGFGRNKKEEIQSEQATKEENQDEPVEYGVDVSFPMHHHGVSTNYPWLDHNMHPDKYDVPSQYKGMSHQPLGNKQKFYEDFMDGCRTYYGKTGKACDGVERDRIDMSFKQPQSMQNYTELGFKKIRAPEALFSMIKEFWDKNKETRKPEKWFSGNTYTNHWESPTVMVSVEDHGLRGGGQQLKQRIWDAAKDVLQEWTGEELTQCSLYGIRVYPSGAMLAPHVDRLPLVSSAIINVAQDVDEPWPIEVIGHDRKAHNVTMEPGDMVLYESHSILHGRPFPLKGRYFANLFVHFEPTGHSLRHHGIEHEEKDVHEEYKKNVKKAIGGHENDNVGIGIPAYIKEDTPWEKKWKATHQDEWHPTKKNDADFSTGSTEAHAAAIRGDVDRLKEIAVEDPEQIHTKDINGWKPLHEAARAGHNEAVALLVGFGSDINERTLDGKGGTPLFYAKHTLGKKHGVISFMESLGALSIGPEL